MPSTFLKRLPGPVGSDQSHAPKGHAHRVVVAGRSPGWPEERHHPALGQARDTSVSIQGPTHLFGVYLRRDLPRPRQGGRFGAAALRHPRHDAPPRRDIRRRRARGARRAAPRSSRMARLKGAGHCEPISPSCRCRLMPLPPKCPELNPVENVWPFMRDNWLSNRVFKSYDDILDHCCFAWNRITDHPWRIMSLGLRTWAHRF